MHRWNLQPLPLCELTGLKALASSPLLSLSPESSIGEKDVVAVFFILWIVRNSGRSEEMGAGWIRGCTVGLI